MAGLTSQIQFCCSALVTCWQSSFCHLKTDTNGKTKGKTQARIAQFYSQEVALGVQISKNSNKSNQISVIILLF